ncbi:hypothetical protein FB451DRAFT_1478556 [Mycena latifolia]|nr:hypothetical protein FB451DRAFT_1478556 [Mycena latifolia]
MAAICGAPTPNGVAISSCLSPHRRTQISSCAPAHNAATPNLPEMHRGFTIPELVRLILTEIRLSPYVGGGPDRRALAVLARTCTTFLGPALDLLWSHQDTLVHFLETFPHDLIETVPDRRSLRLLRAIRPTDWERPLVYSWRIKSLRLNGGIWPVARSPFAALCLRCPGDYMFPNLEALVLNLSPTRSGYASQSATSISFLISPRITKIELHFGDGFGLLSELVPTLAAKIPSLTEVNISMDDDYDTSTLRIVSNFVRSLARIQDLTVTNLDQSTFEHLGRLSALTALKLTNPKVPRTPLPIDAVTSLHPMYSSLTALHFGHTTVDRVIAFIEVVSNAPLEKFETSLFDTATSDAIGRLYSALVAHCSNNSLQRISIDGRASSEGDVPDQYRIGGATLRTLFCFVNVVSVSLDQPFGFDLDDADIFDLAHAWRQLEFLALKGCSDWKPRITVQGLYAFAQQCPNLRYLEITVDATVVVPEPPAGSVSQDSLRTLTVSRSPIRQPNGVVVFLSTIFPQADVDSDFYNEDPASEGW